MLVFQALYACAQASEDSIYRHEEVVIEVNRSKQFTSGNTIQSIEPAIIRSFHSANLGDLLSQHSQIFIKSSGPGNLATVSARGSNAHHTPVLWNGFNIQSPTLGQIDFSLFPVFFADEVDVQYGGAGSLFGSGAVGGVIHMNNRAKFNSGVQAGIGGSYGSFGTLTQSASFKISRKKVISSVKLFNTSAKNNFPFTNDALFGRPESIQTNAKVKQTGLLWENHLAIKENQQINLRIWLQENYRQIPPLMTNNISVATLSSDFYRITSEWKRSGNRTTWFARTGIFHDILIYNDDLSHQFSKTRYTTSVSEAEVNIRTRKRGLLNVGINNTYHTARSHGYPGGPHQNRAAYFTSYKMKNRTDTWKGIFSLRQEMAEGKLVPFTPSAGFEGLLLQRLSLKGNVSRNYRLPTFNDLYWEHGGNKNLTAESGWSEELTLTFQPKALFFSENKIQTTVYNSNLHNMIMWVPPGIYVTDTNSFWTSRNIQAVWSRGLEATFKATKKIRDFNFRISAMYNYVVSTNQKSKSPNDYSVGKQLIYVPVYSAQGNFTVSYKKNHLSYVHTYTGNRFTSTDNSTIIHGYQLGNLTLNGNLSLGKTMIDLYLKINNIWDTSYQVVLWQAMPGRNFQTGVSLMFLNPETKN